MPSPPFPPRPIPPSRQDDPYAGARAPPRVPPNIPARPYLQQNEASRTPRSILRPTPPSHMSTPHHPTPNPLISRSQPLPPIPRSTTTSPYNHHHTSSSPELRPHADNAWAPRVCPHPQQHLPDLSQTGNPSISTHPSSHIIPRPRADQDDIPQRRSGFAARVNPQLVPGFRGRSASDVRIVHTPPPDLDPDRLARACGQQAPYRHDDRGRQPIHIDPQSSRLKDNATVRTIDAAPSHPPVPKARVSHMYRRLDALTRRFTHRAMDYISFEDVAVIHKRDSHLREQLRRKRSDRLHEKDPNFRGLICRRSGLSCRCSRLSRCDRCSARGRAPLCFHSNRHRRVSTLPPHRRRRMRRGVDKDWLVTHYSLFRFISLIQSSRYLSKWPLPCTAESRSPPPTHRLV